MIISIADSYKYESRNITFKFSSDKNLYANDSLINMDKDYNKLLKLLNKFGKSSKGKVGLDYKKLGVNVGGTDNEILYILIYFTEFESYPDIRAFKGGVFLNNHEINSKTTLEEIQKLYKVELVSDNLYSFHSGKMSFMFLFGNDGKIIELKVAPIIYLQSQ